MATPQTRSTGNGRGRPTGGARVAVEDSRTEPGGEQRAGERRGSASQQAGAQAAEILAPESGLAALDPVSFSKALGRFGSEVARRPLPTIAAVARCGTGLSLTGLAAAGRAVGVKTPGALPPAPKDKRFADRAWEDNAAFFATGQAYRLIARLVDDLLAVAELEEPWNGKAAFALRALVDALAPTNFLATNPAALKRAFETGGVSLMRGFRNVMNDITGSEKVNMVGLCLGGSLTAMLLAYMAAKGDNRINSATLLNTLVDFSEPGTLGTFSDAESVARLEKKMERVGYLDSNEM